MTRPLSHSALLADRPGASALERGAETLEDIYRRWEAARQQWAEAERGFDEEARRLDEEGDFLLGTIQAAQGTTGGSAPEDDALMVADALPRFSAEAEGRLAVSRAALVERKRQAAERAGQVLEEGRAEVQAALGRYRSHAPLRLVLMRRPLAGGRAILHLERPGPDAAMVLAWVLTGKVPTRYGYLFDEASDDSLQAPTFLYPEAGVSPDAVRPDPGQLRALLNASGAELPLRGMIPAMVPLPGGGASALVRWRSRGAVLELEWEEAGGFRNLLTATEASAAAGALLRLQLQGELELELQAG